MAGRRRHERAPGRMDVAYEEPGRQVFMPALNLSASGVFLACAERPQLGVSVQLVLSLPPDGLFVRLQGRVVRHAGALEPSGFAVAFDGVDTRTSRTLLRYVHGASAAS